MVVTFLFFSLYTRNDRRRQLLFVKNMEAASRLSIIETLERLKRKAGKSLDAFAESKITLDDAEAAVTST